jgi:hypothetical protein
MISIQRDCQDATLTIDLELARNLEQAPFQPQAAESVPARDVTSHLSTRPGNQGTGQLSQQGRPGLQAPTVLEGPSVLTYLLRTASRFSTPPTHW